MKPKAKGSVPAAVLPELCHSLMERAPVPMAELEGAGHVIRYVNPAFCRLVGKVRKRLMGKPIAEIVQEGDRCLEVLDRVYRTTEAETHTESEHPGTHPAYWSYAIWPVLDGNQRSVGIVMQVTETTLFHQQTSVMNEKLLLSSVHQHELTEVAENLNDRLRVEIAERERAAEGLHESEERFRTLVSVVTDVTWRTDPEGHFITPQAAWEAYTGQSWEQHRRLGWIDAFHPEDRERFKEIWNEACLRRALFQSDGRLWHASTQHWRYFMARARPLLNADDSVREWVGTCIDCDDQKRAQERLEDTVGERTRDLQQANTALLRDMEERKKLHDQLLQAQKMESIGTLAGGIAHDFNNILGIIQGYAFILNGYGSHNREIDESLTIINETVQRGSTLVQQLLTLARKSSTKVEAVDINGLVTELIRLLTQTFPKIIEFSSALEANLPPITGDKNQIEQALLNLCVNSRDAMPNGGRLNFRTQSIDGANLQHLGETRDRRYVCLEVNDTGIGMDEGIQKRIFEPFFTTKGIGHGTGLGLSVVYGIVESHKGFIDLESNPESGTSFKLYFPLRLLGETPATNQIIKASFETTEGTNGRGTILVVEDERNMMKLLYKVLEQHGYKILTASDGETAVETYQHSKKAIDVVLLDLGLPKMTGREVLRHIKNENPDAKVVIASGYLEPEVKSEIDRAGVKYFLSKPYRPDEVVQALQSLIERES